MTRRALVLSLLLVVPIFTVLSNSAEAHPDDIGSRIFFNTTHVDRPSRNGTQWLSSNGLGVQHIAGWLISATVYGLCLTTSIPEFVDGEPLLTTVRLSRGATANTGNIANLGPWATTLARSVGAVMVSFDDGDRHNGQPGFRIALLPIGPASSGGLSIAGCFSFL